MESLRTLARTARSIAGAAALLAAAAQAQGVVETVPPARILPAHPTSFERVNLRMIVDSCTFNASTVRVSADAGVIRVSQRPNMCLVPGTPREVDVLLGAFPAGDYRVELAGPDGTVDPRRPDASIAFSVSDPAEPAVFPPPPRPLTDYSGVWWNAQEPGWGLGIAQSPLHAVFATLYVYGADGAPQWFTLQGGRWTSATTWTGTVYYTTGTPLAAARYERFTSLRAAGTATLDFAPDLGPGVSSTGYATLAYTIDGITATKTLSRMPF